MDNLCYGGFQHHTPLCYRVKATAQTVINGRGEGRVERFLKVKDFERFQHYKNRKPPWVKLYRDLWHEPNFLHLSLSAKAVAIGCLTLASQTGNHFPEDPHYIGVTLGVLRQGIDIGKIIKSLIQADYLVVDASNLLARPLISGSVSVSDPDLRSDLRSDPDPDPSTTAGSPTKAVSEKGPSQSEPEEERLTPEDLKDGWNEICAADGGLPKVRELTRTRKSKAIQRIKEHPEPQWWEETMTRIAHSPFCCGQVPGKNGAKPWQASFDWLIGNDTNAVKAFEGRYSDAQESKRF